MNYSPISVNQASKLKSLLSGSLVALVTPFKTTGAVDLAHLRSLIHWHIDNNTQAIVVLGTTGEAATVNDEERVQIIEAALKAVDDKKTVRDKKIRKDKTILDNEIPERTPVIVGTGTNSTEKTIQLTRQAYELGADAALIVTPYYNRPTQEGLFRHYEAIANACPIPIILYNVPARTGVDLLPETVARLLATPLTNIIGIKEAANDLSRLSALKTTCEEKILLFSGDDATAASFLLQGGDGVISVTANVAPNAMQAMCMAALAKNTEKARALDKPLQGLHKHLFIEANPIPVKWALEQLGLIEGGIRLPLTPLFTKYHPIVYNALQEAGVIND